MHGIWTDEGAVGGLLVGATSSINIAVCRTLGANFLPVMLTNINKRCPGGYFTPETFESFEKLCKCYTSDPKLQRCFSLTAITIVVDIPGVSDITGRVAKCCNTDRVSKKSLCILENTSKDMRDISSVLIIIQFIGNIRKHYALPISFEEKASMLNTLYASVIQHKKLS